MDGGLSGGAAAPYHRAGGRFAEWRLPWQTGQVLCPSVGVGEEDL